MPSKTQFAGAVVLITGGASGIGRALAEACARRGAEVVVADRQLEVARDVARGICEAGGRAYAADLDVRDAAAFEALAAEVLRRSGRIDVFFNNAGIAVAGEAVQYRRRDWDDVLDVNVRGVAYGVQAVYPRMIAQGAGHIVNTASVAGLIPSPGGVSYSTSKHAVVGLSKALRIEAASYGVRVSVLCPGFIRTPILEGGRFGRVEHVQIDEATRSRFMRLARPMEPRDFAEQALRGVEANERTIIVPRHWRAVGLLERMAPRLSEMLWGTVYRRSRRLLTHRAHAPEEARRNSMSVPSSS